MQNHISLRVFLISFSLFFFNISIVSVFGQCLADQRSLLLELRDSLIFESILPTKLVQWNQSVDCCRWSGVNCDNAGHVIGLDLDDQAIEGGLNDSSSLFNLRYLQVLNLANNNFDSYQLPSAFGKLSNLMDLNLSNSRFEGQVPREFSLLTRLVSLSLSSSSSSLNLTNPNLDMLIKNLTQLRELHLDGLVISTKGYSWSQSIASHLPELRILSLRSCQLSGPLDSSLLKLRHLSVIQLDYNPLFSPVPESFSRFSNLTLLSMVSCDLNGTFPPKIFQMPTLQSIDLSINNLLEGVLPEFPLNGSLQSIALGGTKFSGKLPASIGELRMLSRIYFSSCNFTGPIPPSSFSNIEHLDLSNNSLSGSIPGSLFSLPELVTLDLSNNLFSGQINELANAPSPVLNTLDLTNNQLEGSIPNFFFQLGALEVLSLSSNNFNGSVELSKLSNLVNLTRLNLSYNNLSVITSTGSRAFSSQPQFSHLYLAACKLQEVPDLKNQSRLRELDLSGNQMSGPIPNWIWQVGDGYLPVVNLSHNHFSHLQEPYTFGFHNFLDLHSNLLQGEIPIPPASVAYLDYSSNSFESSIPSEIGNSLHSVFFFSMSNNKVVGKIPLSMCNATRLEVLDLSNNSLEGTIPPCLSEMSSNLGVLDLRRNNLSGMIPVSFPKECSLETLDLSDNQLEGEIPKGLSKCTKLEVLNIGKNRVNDTFPCWLKNMTNLRVLVLRSNSFQGKLACPGDDYSWPNLQIMDLSSNMFRGVLPPQLFSSLKAIMVDTDKAKSKLDHLHFDSAQINKIYYQDTVILQAKGMQREWVKILTIFSSIDLSNNSFHGSIPVTVGELKSANVLDVSHNALTGTIPSSIGNLTQLESLDLSVNKLSGDIPTQLASLTFLSFLNLSYNKLGGMIPRGSQFATFTEASFRGNKGLCGVPLTTLCKNAKGPILPPATSQNEDSESETEIYLSVALGFLVGLIIIFGPLVLFKRWRTWYNKHADRIVMRIVNKLDQGRRNIGTTHPERQFRDLIDSEDEFGSNSTNEKIQKGKSVSNKKAAK